MKRSTIGALVAVAISAAMLIGAPSAALATDKVCVPSEGSPAVEYQPAVYGEPPLISAAVEYAPAVYEVEYEFVHKFDVWHLNPKWKADPNWNAESNPQSKGWIATGETRNGKLISAEVLAQDAEYGPAPLISAEVLAQDAVDPVVCEEEPEIPAQPEDDVDTVSTTVTDCDADTVTVTTVTTRTVYVWDGEEWVLGTPVAGDPVVEVTEADDVDCPPIVVEPPTDIPVDTEPLAPTFVAECASGPVNWEAPRDGAPWLYEQVDGFVQAYLPEGYVIASGPQAGERYWEPVWYLADYVDEEACPAQGPVDEEEPPVIGTPETPESPEPSVATPDEDPAPAALEQQSDALELAVTGQNKNALIALVAVGVVGGLVGLLFMITTRRRKGNTQR